MDEHNQPEYGQTKQPQYGAMSGQYPGYDPYLYGKPEPEQPAESANVVQQNPMNGQPYGNQPNVQNGQQYAGQQGQPYNPYAQQHPYTQQQDQCNPYGNQPPQPNMPRIQYLNPDDPAQNPFYGRWDSYAIVAFVCALFAVPVFPAVIGGLSLVRTKRLHMRGRGLAIAAIVINVLTTLLQAYLLINGITINDVYSQMFNTYLGGSGNGGGAGDGSISA